MLSKFCHELCQEELKCHKSFRDNDDYKKGQIYNWQKEEQKDEPRQRQREKGQIRRYKSVQIHDSVSSADFLGIVTTTLGEGVGTTEKVEESTTGN